MRAAAPDDHRKEAAKPQEVVFLHASGTVKSAPVKRGISDDTYVEILEGLGESDEVVSGSYKAISRELKDGTRVKLAPAPTPDKPAPRT